MRGGNQFMKQIHFEMEGTPTPEQPLVKNDYVYLYLFIHPKKAVTQYRVEQ
jgi:hypothetical protein